MKAQKSLTEDDLNRQRAENEVMKRNLSQDMRERYKRDGHVVVGDPTILIDRERGIAITIINSTVPLAQVRKD